MLKEKFEQAKEFVVEHKKEIAIVALTAVGGAVVWKVVKSVPSIETPVDKIIIEAAESKVTEYLPRPDLAVGVVDDLWVDQFGKGLILNEFSVGDMGKIGEELLKIDGITKETEVTAVLGLLDSVEKVVEF